MALAWVPDAPRGESGVGTVEKCITSPAIGLVTMKIMERFPTSTAAR